MDRPDFFAPFIDIAMNFKTVKYLAMQKVQTHVGAISKLCYDFASVRAIIHELWH